MKKILATVLGMIFAMFAFAGCNMAAADGTTTGASGITSIVMMVVIIAVFYFLMIVPEKKRKKKAQEFSVPPYIIFGDKTMYDIAIKKPKTLQELLSVHGIGETKAKTFGKEILKIIEM